MSRCVDAEYMLKHLEIQSYIFVLFFTNEGLRGP